MCLVQRLPFTERVSAESATYEARDTFYAGLRGPGNQVNMEIALDDFPLPNLDDLDLSELSYDDESLSPTSSSDYCSPLSSPTSLDTQLDSPSSNSSVSSQSGSVDCAKTSGNTSPTSQKYSKHKAKCQAPHCIKREHISILRRNERERNRVKLVSDGFANLRKHVPTTPLNKKLSKVETLRTAIEYIRHLQKVLNESNRLERERRLLHQVGWYHEAFKLQVKGFITLSSDMLATVL